MSKAGESKVSLAESLLFSHRGLLGLSGLCRGTSLSKQSSVLLVKQGQPPGPATDTYKLREKCLTWLFGVSLEVFFAISVSTGYTLGEKWNEIF